MGMRAPADRVVDVASSESYAADRIILHDCAVVGGGAIPQSSAGIVIPCENTVCRHTALESAVVSYCMVVRKIASQVRATVAHRSAIRNIVGDDAIDEESPSRRFFACRRRSHSAANLD